MFTVDGMSWDFPCDIERTAELTQSEISGMLLNKQFFNDVIGTYLRYTVTLVVPFGAEGLYTRLYETMTDPVDAHTFVMPYNQGTITITGRVEHISDIVIQMPDGSIHWKGISFEVVGSNPTKTHTLSDVITMGLSPLPEISGPNAGDIYEYNGYEWEPYDVENADEKAY